MQNHLGRSQFLSFTLACLCLGISARAAETCEAPNLSNTVVINMAFSYPDSTIELGSKEEDLAFFRRVALSLGLKPHVLTDSSLPSKEAIVDFLKIAVRGKKHVYFNYSGHGELVDGKRLALLMPYNLEKAAADPTAASLPPVYLFKDELDQIFQGTNIYYILDACHSGAALSSCAQNSHSKQCLLCSTQENAESSEGIKVGVPETLVKATKTHHAAIDKFTHDLIRAHEKQLTAAAQKAIEKALHRELKSPSAMPSVRGDAFSPEMEDGFMRLPNLLTPKEKKRYAALKKNSSALRSQWEGYPHSPASAFTHALSVLGPEVKDRNGDGWFSAEEIRAALPKDLVQDFSLATQRPMALDSGCKSIPGGYPLQLFRPLPAAAASAAPGDSSRERLPDEDHSNAEPNDDLSD